MKAGLEGDIGDVDNGSVVLPSSRYVLYSA